MKNLKLLLIVVILCKASSLIAQQWQNVTPKGYTAGIYCNSFINSNEGWLCVRDSSQVNLARLIHTSNACIDWDTCFAFPDGLHFNKLQMIDSLHGFAIGRFNQSLFWRTDDGGHSWNDITNDWLMNNNGPLAESSAFVFIDATTGFYGGSMYLFKTTDGGFNWSPIVLPTDADPSTPEIDDYLVQNIYFADSVHGWISCRYAFARTCTFYSADGGSNWQPIENHGGYPGMFHFSDNLHGAFIAYPDFIPYLGFTNDNFYTKQLIISDPYLNSTYVQNDSVIWIGFFLQHMILKTSDFGNSFDTLYPQGTGNNNYTINEFKFFGNTGYAFGHYIFKYVDTLNTAVHPIPITEYMMSVYPNPSINTVDIGITVNESEKVTIELHTIEGKCVLVKKENLCTGDNHIRLSVKHLEAGIYLLSLKGNSINSARKLVIER